MTIQVRHINISTFITGDFYIQTVSDLTALQ